MALTDFGSGDVLEGMFETSKLKIVGAGVGGGASALARYKRDGTLDG